LVAGARFLAFEDCKGFFSVRSKSFFKCSNSPSLTCSCQSANPRTTWMNEPRFGWLTEFVTPTRCVRFSQLTNLVWARTRRVSPVRYLNPSAQLFSMRTLRRAQLPNSGRRRPVSLGWLQTGMANHPLFSTIERLVFALALCSKLNHFILRVSHLARSKQLPVGVWPQHEKRI
jgi:hypothetical protein